MDVFSQLVYTIGRITREHFRMLGAGYLVGKDGKVATTHHVACGNDANLAILAPYLENLNEFQDIADNHRVLIPVNLKALPPAQLMLADR